eukprot:s552_g5.t1
MGPVKVRCTACERLRFCVCDKEMSVLFTSKLAKSLKKYFGTKKAGSAENIAQESKYVLHLYQGDDHDGAWQSGTFLHVGFVNFSTWQVGCLQLDPCCLNTCFRTLMLQVSLDENERPKVSMLLEFVAMNLDTTLAYKFQLYRIVGAKEHLIEDFMMPCYVDVKKESTPVCFWLGDESESKPSKKRPVGSQNQDQDLDLLGGPRSKPRPRPPRKPRQDSRNEQEQEEMDEPDEQDDDDDADMDDEADPLMDMLFETDDDADDTAPESEDEGLEGEPAQDQSLNFEDLLKEAEAEMNLNLFDQDSAAASNEIPPGDVLLRPEPVHEAEAHDADDDNVPAGAAAGPAVPPPPLLAPDEAPADFGYSFALFL